MTIIELPLKKNVDPNIQCNLGMTGFYSACYYGFVDIVKILLQSKKIDFNIQNNQGYTTFHSSCDNNQTKIIELLLRDKRININMLNTQEYTAFQTRIYDRFGILNLLVNKRINLNTPDKSGHTIFHICCLYNKFKIVVSLLKDERIDFNKKNKTGETAFTMACFEGNLKIAKLFCNKRIIVDEIYNHLFDEHDHSFRNKKFVLSGKNFIHACANGKYI